MLTIKEVKRFFKDHTSLTVDDLHVEELNDDLYQITIFNTNFADREFLDAFNTEQIKKCVNNNYLSKIFTLIDSNDGELVFKNIFDESSFLEIGMFPETGLFKPVNNENIDTRLTDANGEVCVCVDIKQEDVSKVSTDVLKMTVLEVFKLACESVLQGYSTLEIKEAIITGKLIGFNIDMENPIKQGSSQVFQCEYTNADKTNFTFKFHYRMLLQSMVPIITCVEQLRNVSGEDAVFVVNKGYLNYYLQQSLSSKTTNDNLTVNDEGNITTDDLEVKLHSMVEATKSIYQTVQNRKQAEIVTKQEQEILKQKAILQLRVEKMLVNKHEQQHNATFLEIYKEWITAINVVKTKEELEKVIAGVDLKNSVAVTLQDQKNLCIEVITEAVKGVLKNEELRQLGVIGKYKEEHRTAEYECNKWDRLKNKDKLTDVEKSKFIKLFLEKNINELLSDYEVCTVFSQTQNNILHSIASCKITNNIIYRESKGALSCTDFKILIGLSPLSNSSPVTLIQEELNILERFLTARAKNNTALTVEEKIVSGKSYCKISGDNIAITAIIKHEKFKELWIKGIIEVQIIASGAVFLDADVILPSTNVVIVGDNVKVCVSNQLSQYKINTSGLPVVQYDILKAKSGKDYRGNSWQNSGVNGADGRKGVPGMSAGNIFIRGISKLEGFENIDLKADGSVGTNGQFGGDGDNGVIGNHGANGYLKDDWYICSRTMLDRGELGNPGGQAGSGGRGGCAGGGGNNGIIIVVEGEKQNKDIMEKFQNVEKSAKSGQPGKCGVDGIPGEYGKRGTDHARTYTGFCGGADLEFKGYELKKQTAYRTRGWGWFSWKQEYTEFVQNGNGFDTRNQHLTRMQTNRSANIDNTLQQEVVAVALPQIDLGTWMNFTTNAGIALEQENEIDLAQQTLATVNANLDKAQKELENIQEQYASVESLKNKILIETAATVEIRQNHDYKQFGTNKELPVVIARTSLTENVSTVGGVNAELFDDQNIAKCLELNSDLYIDNFLKNFESSQDFKEIICSLSRIVPFDCLTDSYQQESHVLMNTEHVPHSVDNKQLIPSIKTSFKKLLLSKPNAGNLQALVDLQKKIPVHLGAIEQSALDAAYMSYEFAHRKQRIEALMQQISHIYRDKLDIAIFASITLLADCNGKSYIERSYLSCDLENKLAMLVKTQNTLKCADYFNECVLAAKEVLIKNYIFVYDFSELENFNVLCQSLGKSFKYQCTQKIIFYAVKKLYRQRMQGWVALPGQTQQSLNNDLFSMLEQILSSATTEDLVFRLKSFWTILDQIDDNLCKHVDNVEYFVDAFPTLIKCLQDGLIAEDFFNLFDNTTKDQETISPDDDSDDEIDGNENELQEKRNSAIATVNKCKSIIDQLLSTNSQNLTDQVSEQVTTYETVLTNNVYAWHDNWQRLQSIDQNDNWQTAANCITKNIDSAKFTFEQKVELISILSRTNNPERICRLLSTNTVQNWPLVLYMEQAYTAMEGLLATEELSVKQSLLEQFSKALSKVQNSAILKILANRIYLEIKNIRAGRAGMSVNEILGLTEELQKIVVLDTKVFNTLGNLPLSGWERVLYVENLHARLLGIELSDKSSELDRDQLCEILLRYEAASKLNRSTIESLVLNLQTKKCNIFEVLTLFNECYAGKILLGDAQIKKLNESGWSNPEIIDALHNELNHKKELKTDDITSIMKDDPYNASINSLLGTNASTNVEGLSPLVHELTIVERLITERCIEPKEQHIPEVTEFFKVFNNNLSVQNQTIVSNLEKKPISTWNTIDIKNFARIFREEGGSEELQQHQGVLLAIVAQGLKCIKGFYPRNVQLAAVVTMLHGNEHGASKIAEIATGEGKTEISAILAVMLSFMGKPVDVITSSSALAAINVRSIKKFIKIFGYTVECISGVECQEQAVLAERYKATILYGTMADFQRVELLDQFFNTNIDSNRSAIAIIDEADSLLVEEMLNTLYLSPQDPELKSLNPILCIIFRTVCEYLSAKTNPQAGLTEEDKQQIQQSINKKVCSGDFSVPNRLHAYLARRLPAFINHAVEALYSQRDGIYICERDVEDNDEEKLYVIDQGTGVTRFNTTFSDGLQQFLEIIYTRRMSGLSLKGVYQSVSEKIKQYKNVRGVLGITGTAGDVNTRRFYNEMFGVDTVRIPRFCYRKFFEESPVVVKNQTEQFASIAASIADKIKEKRAILVVCETIDTAKQLYEYLKNTKEFTNGLHHRLVSHADFTCGTEEQPLQPGEIIISTNLSGRGTDLQVSTDVKGGLFTISTGEPCNVTEEQLEWWTPVPDERKLEQIFGRSARKGLPGSGQQIVVDPLKRSFSTLLQLRNNNMLIKLHKLQHEKMLPITIEAQLFTLYSKFRSEIREQLCSKKNDPFWVEQQLHGLMGYWELWLDELAQKMEEYPEYPYEQAHAEFLVFKQDMLNILLSHDRKFLFLNRWTNLIQMGQHYDDKGKHDDANQCYQEAIKQEPNYAFAAYLGIAHNWLRNGDMKARKQARTHLKCAGEIINQRILELQQSISLLASNEAHEKIKNSIMKRYGKLANQLKEALENEIFCYQTHLNAIEKAIGKPISLEIVASIYGANETDQKKRINNAQEILARLIQRDEIKGIRFSKKASLETPVGMQEKRFYYANPATGQCWLIEFPDSLKQFHNKVCELYEKNTDGIIGDFAQFKTVIFNKEKLTTEEEQSFEELFLFLVRSKVIKEIAVRTSCAGEMQYFRDNQKNPELTQLFGSNEADKQLGHTVLGILNLAEKYKLTMNSIETEGDYSRLRDLPKEELLEFHRRHEHLVLSLERILEQIWTWRNTLALLLGVAAMVAGVITGQFWLFSFGMNSIEFAVRSYVAGNFDMVQYMISSALQVVLSVVVPAIGKKIAGKMTGIVEGKISGGFNSMLKEYTSMRVKNATISAASQITAKALSTAIRDQLNGNGAVRSDNQAMKELRNAMRTHYMASNKELDAINDINDLFKQAEQEELASRDYATAQQTLGAMSQVSEGLLKAARTTDSTTGMVYSIVAGSMGELHATYQSYHFSNKVMQSVTKKLKNRTAIMQEIGSDFTMHNNENLANLEQSFKVYADGFLQNKSKELSDMALNRFNSDVVTPLVNRSLIVFADYLQREAKNMLTAYNNAKNRHHKQMDALKKGALDAVEERVKQQDNFLREEQPIITTNTKVEITDANGNKRYTTAGKLITENIAIAGCEELGKKLVFNQENKVYELRIADQEYKALLNVYTIVYNAKYDIEISRDVSVEQDANLAQIANNAAADATVIEREVSQTNTATKRNTDEQIITLTSEYVRKHEVGGTDPEKYLHVHQVNGVPHIGIGFNLNRKDAAEKLAQIGVKGDVKQAINSNSLKLNQQQAENLFKICLHEKLQYCKKLIPNFDKLPLNVQIPIVDIAYNSPSLMGKKFKAAIATGDYSTAAYELVYNTKYNKGCEQGQAARRKEMAALLTSDVTNTQPVRTKDNTQPISDDLKKTNANVDQENRAPLTLFYASKLQLATNSNEEPKLTRTSTQEIVNKPNLKKFINKNQCGVFGYNVELQITSDFAPTPNGRTLTIRGVKITGPHYGVDLIPKNVSKVMGHPIIAREPMVVLEVKHRSGYGNTLTVWCPERNAIQLFAHLDKTSCHLKFKPGQKLESGIKIANVGNTGHGTGPHLHLEEFKTNYNEIKQILKKCQFFPRGRTRVRPKFYYNNNHNSNELPNHNNNMSKLKFAHI